MNAPIITTDDPRRSDIRNLLRAHLDFAASQSPPEDVHALDIEGLTQSSVSFFSARQDGTLLGVGALKELDPIHGEIKSMHTAEAARGQGIARSLLDHLLGVARGRGYHRVSLETGTMEGFAPARSLYESAGFVECPPFANYWDSPHSVCMTIELTV